MLYPVFSQKRICCFYLTVLGGDRSQSSWGTLRMNISQILECHLGRAAKEMGIYTASPVYDGAVEDDIMDTLRSRFTQDGKQCFMTDAREPYDDEITIGYIYVEMAHLVDDKIHARSTGLLPCYSQPLGEKGAVGGQRFGEMEVWALEAYGAAYSLQEILTVKSDDVVGRVKTYEAIVKGENVPEPGVPESFKVLIKELRAGLDVRVLSESNEEVEIRDDEDDIGETARELELDDSGVTPSRVTKKSSPALDEEDSDQDDEEELPVEDIQEESDSEETVSDDVLEYMGLEDYSSGENDEISEEAEIDPSEDEDSVSQRPKTSLRQRVIRLFQFLMNRLMWKMNSVLAGYKKDDCLC